MNLRVRLQTTSEIVEITDVPPRMDIVRDLRRLQFTCPNLKIMTSGGNLPIYQFMLFGTDILEVNAHME